MTQLVQTAPFGIFLIALATAAGFAGISLYAGVRSWMHMRALTSMSPVPIAGAPKGYIRIEGFAEPFAAEPVRAPLTHSPVCWYRFLVEDSASGRRSKDNVSWRQVDGESSGQLFLVCDNSGRVLIDPADAEITPTDRSIWYGPNPEPDDRNPRRFPPGQNPKGDFIQVEWSGGGSHRYRFTEERIYPGDPIFVQGELRLEEIDADDEEAEDGGEDKPEAPGTAQLCIGKPARRSQPFLIATTSPGDMVNIHRYAIIGTAVITALGLAAVVQLIRIRYGL